MKTLHFKLEKETKGALRYREEGDNPVAVTLYVRKWAFPEQPKRLEVTIREAPETATA